jgi:membrane protease YdiL (CAAX protease family)
MKKQSFRAYLLILVLFSGIFTALAYLKVDLEFYIWEFLIDLKICLIFLALAYLMYREKRPFSLKELGFFTFNWKSCVFAFLLPLLLAGLIVIIGFFFGQLKYGDPDNPSTQLLGLVFDIPAICVFSISTIMLEELIFRTGYFTLGSEIMGKNLLILLGTLVWGIYSLPKLILAEEPLVLSLSSISLYWISIGLCCMRLYAYTKSIWNIYFFRIGVLIFFPLLLGNFAAETDPFFSAKSNLFLGDGIIVSILLIISSFFFKKRRNTNQFNCF